MANTIYQELKSTAEPPTSSKGATEPTLSSPDVAQPTLPSIDNPDAQDPAGLEEDTAMNEVDRVIDEFMESGDDATGTGDGHPSTDTSRKTGTACPHSYGPLRWTSAT